MNCLFLENHYYQLIAALDEDEFVELLEVSLEVAQSMVADQRIFDAKTAFAVLWLAAHLENNL